MHRKEQRSKVQELPMTASWSHVSGRSACGLSDGGVARMWCEGAQNLQRSAVADKPAHGEHATNKQRGRPVR